MLKTKTKWLGSPWVLAGVLAVTVGASTDAAAQAVKKSSSGICHCPGGQSYDRTTNFTEYETLEACLDSGGREPRRGQVDCRMESSSDATALMRPPDRHERSASGGWSDEDGDRQNTRHERLIARSTAPVELSEDGCQILRGRWMDPYTGNVHVAAQEIEIDHLGACRTRDSRFTHLIDIIAFKILFWKDPVLKRKALRRKSDRLELPSKGV